MSDDRINWEKLYQDEFTPWDIKRPDSHLMQVVTGIPIKPCRVLEIGCGTGSNAIWLARQGFTVTAIDMSETALKLAKAQKGIESCSLLLSDFLEDQLPGTDFGFVFDLGCFHGFAKPEDRDLFARRVSACLIDSCYWLSIISSTDGPAICPTRRSAVEIATAVEPYFEIISLTAIQLDKPDQDAYETLGIEPGVTPQAWCCLMKKRAPETE